MPPKRPRTKTTTRKVSKRTESPEKKPNKKSKRDVPNTDPTGPEGSVIPKNTRPAHHKRINSLKASSSNRKETSNDDSSDESSHEVLPNFPLPADQPNSEGEGGENSLDSRVRPQDDTDSSYLPEVHAQVSNTNKDLQVESSIRMVEKESRKRIHRKKTKLVTSPKKDRTPSKLLQEKMRVRVEHSGTETGYSDTETGNS